MASPRGPVARPGCQGRPTAGLNKAALDQGWGLLTQMLGRQAPVVWRHAAFETPAHTSQGCAVCGAVDARNRKTQAEFTVSTAITETTPT